jgi:hypothetical protein
MDPSNRDCVGIFQISLFIITVLATIVLLFVTEFLNHKEHEVHEGLINNSLNVILCVLRELRGFNPSI